MLGFKTRPKPGQWGKYVAVALTTSACSLQDYTYLGAGDPNTDTSDETSTNGSETTESDASDVSMTDTVDIDASVPEGGIDDGGDMTTGPVLTDQTDETDTTMVETSDTTAVDASDVGSDDTDTTTDDLDGGSVAPEKIEGNLIPNSSFENPIAGSGWYPFGPLTLSNVEDPVHTGLRSLMAAGRSDLWQGPGISILSPTSGGTAFRARAWVRADEETNSISMSLKWTCFVRDDAGVGTPVDDYLPLATVFATATQWHLLEHVLTVPDCDLTGLDLYFEGPPAGAAFYVDDVSLVPD